MHGLHAGVVGLLHAGVLEMEQADGQVAGEWSGAGYAGQAAYEKGVRSCERHSTG
jgi:hypothetical protein